MSLRSDATLPSLFSSQTTDDDVICCARRNWRSVENILTQKSRGFLELVIGGKP